MTSAAMQFSVPATAESHVRRLVEAANARAAVHHLSAYALDVSEPFLSDYRDVDGRLIGQRPTVTVTIAGDVPRHDGWTVVARLDHDDEGETITSLFPGLSERDAEAASRYRAVANLCHGCAVARHRTATYLARHESGEMAQLGTTCVEPYTGLPIKGLEALWRFGRLKDADWDEDGGEGGYPADLRVAVLEVLRVTAAIVKAEGRFYARSEEWTHAMPTADGVEAYFFDRKAPQEWRDGLDADQDAPRTAAAVRAWAVEGYGSLSDYRHKVGQLTKDETVAPRHLPTLVSAIAGWRRDQGREAAEQAARSSRPQGAVGERLTRNATVTTVIELEGRTYGYQSQRRRLVKFQDGDGNVFIWFSSAADVPDQGDEVELTGTVKDHGVYGETAQTFLTRCRVAERGPVAA
ncbi:hypothetical protein [Streptomyces sp. NPDC060194]|uniref:hypothetical protein n=1 Tax=Streptomyces sp. NPDC060194 TaxID=3347069 RepID=UPI00365AF078